MHHIAPVDVCVCVSVNFTCICSPYFEIEPCSIPETSGVQLCRGNGSAADKSKARGQRLNVTSDCATKCCLYFDRIPHLMAGQIRARVYIVVRVVCWIMTCCEKLRSIFLPYRMSKSARNARTAYVYESSQYVFYLQPFPLLLCLWSYLPFETIPESLRIGVRLS